MTIESKKKRNIRRQGRKKRQKWFIAAFAFIFLPVVVYLLVGCINLNTVLEKSLAPHLDPGLKLSIERAYLGFSRYGPAIRLQNIKASSGPGTVAFDVKNAAVAFDIWSALRGWVVPRTLSASDVNILFVNREEDLIKRHTTPSQKGSSPAVPLEADGKGPISFTDFFLSKKSESSKVPLPLAAKAHNFIASLVHSEGFIRALDHINLRRVHVTHQELKENHEAIKTLINKGRFTFSRLNKKSSDSYNPIAISLAADEKENSWSLLADFRAITHDDIDVRMTFENAPLFKFAQWGGAELPFVKFDVPLSGTLVLALEPKALKTLSVALSNEKGAALLIDDPAIPKVPLNHVQASAVWDAKTQRLVIPSLKFDSGPNRFAFSGDVHFFEPKDPGSPQWTFSLKSPKTNFKGLMPDDKPLQLTTLSLLGEGFPEGRFKSQLIAKGDKIDVTLVGEKVQAESPQITLNLGVKKTDARHFLRLWPVIIAPNAYDYLARNLREGHVDLSGTVRLKGKDLEQLSQKNGVLSENALDLDVTVQDGVLTPAPHVPTVSNLKVHGKITSQRAILHIPQGRMVVKNNEEKKAPFSFEISEGGIQLLDFYTVPQARINFRAQSSVESVIAFLKTPLIGLGSRSVLNDLQVKSGDSDVRVAITLPLENSLMRKDVQVNGQGTLKNVTVAGVYEKESFSKANFSVQLKNTENVVLEGKGHIFGLDTDLRLGIGEVEKPGLVLSTLMTDAIRRNKGWGSQELRGPIKLSMDVPMSEGKGPFISIDLTPAEIMHFVPGWVKPAGEPASLTFMVRDQTLENFSISSKTFSAEGKGTLSKGPKLNISTLDLKSVQWSKGDSVSVLWTRTPQGSHTRLKGSFLNASPFIVALSALTGEKDKISFAIDAAIGRVGGHHGESLSDFSLAMTQKQGKLVEFKLGGFFPSVKGQEKRNLTGRLLPLTTGDNDILILSNEAGSLLRFFGLYQEMEQGGLEFRLDTHVQPSVGRLSIKDFFILNNSFRIPDSKSPRSPNEVSPFSKLNAQFVFGPEVIVRNGLILGPTTGISLEGKINIKAGTLNLFGTYVPAYALNNTFAQIPLIGPILGGGPHEGLFAVSFQVTGPFAAPKTIINPLSALTPGLLRKFFDISR